MRGDVIADEFKKMVWIRDKEGREYACKFGDIKNTKKIEERTEEEQKDCFSCRVGNSHGIIR